MLNKINSFLKNESGQGMTEYIMIIVVIVAVIAVVMVVFGDEIVQKFKDGAADLGITL